MYLLARGAEVNAEDSDGNTALCHALLSDKSDCAIILINKGANIQHRIVNVNVCTYAVEFFALYTQKQHTT